MAERVSWTGLMEDLNELIYAKCLELAWCRVLIASSCSNWQGKEKCAEDIRERSGSQRENQPPLRAAAHLL